MAYYRAGAVVVLGLLLAAQAAWAEEPPPLPDLTGIVKDEGWARILGKALFWDTVASVRGADCSGCHFVTGANRRIPDQSADPLQLRRVALADLSAEVDPVAERTLGIIDVCARSINAAPAELADSGPVHMITRVADEDPTCRQDSTARFAHDLLERKPLQERSINPQDGTFGPSGPHGNLVSPSGRGLERTYQWMIEQAFEEPLWRASAAAVDASDDSASTAPSRVEQNFQLFWGVAVMIYESTLDPRWRRDHQVAREQPLSPAASRATSQ